MSRRTQRTAGVVRRRHTRRITTLACLTAAPTAPVPAVTSALLRMDGLGHLVDHVDQWSVVPWSMSQDAARPSDEQLAAREAAVAEREQRADEREAALDVREAVVETVLSADDDRGVNARKILEDADHRDEVSDARDVKADDREGSASRAAFLDDKNRGGHQPDVRRAAALDRRHSKSDRASAANDRIELAGGDAKSDAKSAKE